MGSARRDARVPLRGPPVAGHRLCQPGRCALPHGHGRACPGVGPVCAGKRPGKPGPRQSPGSAATWRTSERPWAQPGRCVAPLYGLEPGPSGEVRDRCVQLTGLEPGRISVGALNRAAARATPSTKKWWQGDFRPPTVRLLAVVRSNLRKIVHLSTCQECLPGIPSLQPTLALLEPPTPTILFA